MDANFRIKKTNTGYIVEKKVSYFFGLIVQYEPYITYFGSNRAYPFFSYESAKNNLLSQIESELKENSDID